MRGYSALVQMVLTRLVLLIAMLFLPLGMNAPAAAKPHHSMAMDMPNGHCPDQAPKHNTKGGIAECTMGCASTLPAMDRASYGIQPAARVALVTIPAPPLHGLHPDTATPPPKAS